MSHYENIALVTETIRQLLTSAVSNISGTSVTTVRPSLTSGAKGGPPAVGINMFLYQVTHAVTQENLDLPLRRQDGSLAMPPRAALYLHYMVSFYNDADPLVAHKLAGLAAARLFGHPILTRDDVRAAKNNATTSLANADLEDEVELVRLVPENLNLEDLSKLWSVFFQVPYVLCFTFCAGVVYVEYNPEQVSQALPVSQALVAVETLQPPLLTQVLSASDSATAPILPGQKIRLLGRDLQGVKTLARINGLEVTPDSVSPGEIQVTLAEPPFPAASLRPGVLAVQVVHKRMLGNLPAEHAGPESNMLAFALLPTFDPPSAPAGSTTTVNGVMLCTGMLQLKSIKPAVGIQQRVAILLTELNPPSERPAYAFVLPVSLADSPKQVLSVTSISADFEDVPVGEYLVRLQVDGVSSPLETTLFGGGPVYSGPSVKIMGKP